MDSGKSSATSSSSRVPSIVSELPELFRKETTQFSSTGGIFDSVFSPGSRTVGRRGVSASEAAVPWKKTQAECKIWQTKKPSADGISQVAGKDGRNIPTKHGSSGYTGELVEHTLLSSSVHYGGRDDYIEPSTAQAYSETSSILVKSSGEDVSDGGSPRGNWWQGSFYY